MPDRQHVLRKCLGGSSTPCCHEIGVVGASKAHSTAPDKACRVVSHEEAPTGQKNGSRQGAASSLELRFRSESSWSAVSSRWREKTAYSNLVSKLLVPILPLERLKELYPNVRGEYGKFSNSVFSTKCGHSSLGFMYLFLLCGDCEGAICCFPALSAVLGGASSPFLSFSLSLSHSLGRFSSVISQVSPLRLSSPKDSSFPLPRFRRHARRHYLSSL